MKCYVTNTVTSDGYGSKLGRILNLLYFTLYAKDKYNVDIEFLYSPLDYEGFGIDMYGDNEIACYYTSREAYIDRARQWENKLNYKGIKITDVDLSQMNLMYNINYDTLISHIVSGNYDNKLFVLNTLFATMPNSKYNSELDNVFCDKYKDEVIKKFDMVNPFQNNKINISLHMRRNNVTETSYLSDRWLSDEYYLEIIRIIESKLKKDYELTIYTQTNNFNKEKFKKYNIVYDQTSEDYDCFMNFVFSDILALGISSFSLTATYLSKNVIINPPSPHWIKQKTWIETKDLEKTLEIINGK